MDWSRQSGWRHGLDNFFGERKGVDRSCFSRVQIQQQIAGVDGADGMDTQRIEVAQPRANRPTFLHPTPVRDQEMYEMRDMQQEVQL